jgi:hypothetical protein
MMTFEAKVTRIVQLPTYRIRGKPSQRSKDLILTLWRLSLSYLAKKEVYEIELPEPLRQISCTDYSVGTTGLVEFDLFASPPVNVGDRFQVEAYEPGERARSSDEESVVS